MRFFFYGTLIADSGNPVTERVHARLRPLGAAVLRGRLYAIPTLQGWYPAFLDDLRDGAEDGEVHGAAYAALADFGAEDLALLDDYEAYYPDRPEASEYVRRAIVPLRGADGEAAETYVYRAALPDGARAVPHGDFRQFLAETGLPPYRVSAEEIGRKLARLRAR